MSSEAPRKLLWRLARRSAGRLSCFLACRHPSSLASSNRFKRTVPGVRSPAATRPSKSLQLSTQRSTPPTQPATPNPAAERTMVAGWRRREQAAGRSADPACCGAAARRSRARGGRQSVSRHRPALGCRPASHLVLRCVAIGAAQPDRSWETEWQRLRSDELALTGQSVPPGAFGRGGSESVEARVAAFEKTIAWAKAAGWSDVRRGVHAHLVLRPRGARARPAPTSPAYAACTTSPSSALLAASSLRASAPPCYHVARGPLRPYARSTRAGRRSSTRAPRWGSSS